MRWPTPWLVAALLAALVCGCSPGVPVIESVTELADTPDTTGPYRVEAIILGAAGHLVELHYHLDDDPVYLKLPMPDVGDGETFACDLPGRPTGTEISYYVVALLDGERVTFAPVGAGARPYRFRIVAP